MQLHEFIDATLSKRKPLLPDAEADLKISFQWHQPA